MVSWTFILVEYQQTLGLTLSNQLLENEQVTWIFLSWYAMIMVAHGRRYVLIYLDLLLKLSAQDNTVHLLCYKL